MQIINEILWIGFFSMKRNSAHGGSLVAGVLAGVWFVNSSSDPRSFTA